MKNLILAVTIPALFLSIGAEAQTDTTHYDLGNVLVKKNFTQNITIKGSDLERYPFNDLSEAIRTFFYAEVYFSSRNIVQNYYSDITDQRRFYGLGFKLDL